MSSNFQGLVWSAFLSLHSSRCVGFFHFLWLMIAKVCTKVKYMHDLPILCGKKATPQNICQDPEKHQSKSKSKKDPTNETCSKFPCLAVSQKNIYMDIIRSYLFLEGASHVDFWTSPDWLRFPANDGWGYSSCHAQAGGDPERTKGGISLFLSTCWSTCLCEATMAKLDS